MKDLRSAYLRLDVARKMESDATLLTSHLLILQAMTDELPMQRIRFYTQKFFDKEFPSRAVVSIAEKVEGVQLGVVATVSDGQGPTRFFVKTHSGGSLASRKSSGLEPVLPEELLCYRILELLGLGCKFYFFGRDEKNLYLCTRDASADGEYIEYANLLGKDSDKLEEIIGSALKINMEAAKDPETSTIEIDAPRDNDSRDFLQSMLALAMIEWLLNLHDLQSNEGNFGFVRKSGLGWKLCIIDFGAHSIQPMRSRSNGAHLFQTGLSASFCDVYRTCALLRRSTDAKMADGRALLAGLLSDFVDVVALAAKHVSEDFTEFVLKHTSDDQVDRILQGIEKASSAYIENFQAMSDFLGS